MKRRWLLWIGITLLLGSMIWLIAVPEPRADAGPAPGPVVYLIGPLILFAGGLILCGLFAVRRFSKGAPPSKRRATPDENTADDQR